MSTEKNTIKNWFKTGLKPTQAQFWATWDSFWHKDEKLPISSIENLGNLIDGKAEANHSHTEYATNSATSLTPENVTQWQNKLGVADLKFDDQAITTTQDYSEFGLDSGATINAFNNAVYSEVLKKLNAPIENNTSDYVLLADGSTAPQTDFGKVDKVMGIAPDVDKNVDISGVAMNWTNASQRMSALVSKHNDATYNRLLGMDANGNLNEVGLPALTNEMSKSTDAQKDAWRVASLKTNETFATGAPAINSILPFKIENKDLKNNMTCIGGGLYLNPNATSIKLKNIVTNEEYDVIDNNIQVYTLERHLMSFTVNPVALGMPNGTYRVIVSNNGIFNMDSNYFEVVSEMESLSTQNLDFQYYSPTENTQNPKNLLYDSGATIFGNWGDGNIETFLARRPILTAEQASGDFDLEINLGTDNHYYAWDMLYAGITTQIEDTSDNYARNMVEFGMSYGGRYNTRIIPTNTTAPSGQSYSYILIIMKRGLSVTQYLRCINTNTVTSSTRILTSNINKPIYLVVNSQTKIYNTSFNPTESNLKIFINRITV